MGFPLAFDRDMTGIWPGYHPEMVILSLWLHLAVVRLSLGEAYCLEWGGVYGWLIGLNKVIG